MAWCPWLWHARWGYGGCILAVGYGELGVQHITPLDALYGRRVLTGFRDVSREERQHRDFPTRGSVQFYTATY